VWSSVSSSQRILCLWLNRLSTDRVARQSHETAPLVVFGKRGNLDLLLAVDAQAQRLGLTAGLALAQARAMHPALAAMPEDQAGDAHLLDAIADWCQRYTPLVAVDPPDGILLDIGGCAHLFGGEAKLRDDLLARVTGFGLSGRAAIATTIGTAWAAARFSDAAITESKSARECLAPLPLAALRLAPDKVAALARLGLKRIGDILDLPRAPLAARFGTDLLRQLDRALGREDEPLTPRLPVPPYVAERNFHEPIAREEDVLATVERLAARLQTTLTARGDGARRLELALFRTDGLVKRIAAGTSRPARDPQAIRALFVERLAALGDEIDPGFGFDLARLSVLVAEPCPDEQIGLGTRAALASEASGQRGHSISARAGHSPELGSSAREDQAELDRLVDRLSARLGRRRVSRLVANDSHIPELAATAMPAQIKTEPGWDAFRRFHAETGMSPRPLRLLAKPEPIDEVMALVPDGPPLRFRWRRALHEVVAAEGPERISGDWWSEQGWPLAPLASATRADEPGSGEYPARALLESSRWPLASATRDYFRIEDKTGLRFWLFRSGLYRDVIPGQSPPRWFLHGMYA
jgi:protein ImuB